MHSTTRLRDTPMDFAYDSPSRQRHAASSMWLDPPSSSDVGSSSLSPTIAGPDVDMVHDASLLAQARKNKEQLAESGRGQTLSNYDDPDTHESGARRIPSYGALTRSNRQRKANNGLTGRRRTRETASRFKSSPEDHKNDEIRSKNDGSEEDDDDWLDDEDDARRINERRRKGPEGRVRSLSKRVGDTLNIQYFFNGHQAATHDPRQGHHAPHAPSSIAHRWTEPEWCLGMVQFIFNATLLCGIVYVLFHVLATLQRDVSSKVREYEMEYLAEIEACSQNFHLNRCGTSGAVPALASACASWQRCSARDPANVGRARVAAETVAEIVNGFVDVVSWKSMLFTLLMLTVVVGATNSFLSFFRIRSRQSYVGHGDKRGQHGYEDRRTAYRIGQHTGRRMTSGQHREYRDEYDANPSTASSAPPSNDQRRHFGRK